MSSEVIKILFVCTGNQCRSALAEVMTRSLAAGLPVEVSSMGTHSTRSLPSPPETRRAAAMLGYDLEAHRSRGIDAAELGEADLVVGFELSHVASAVVDHGSAGSRTWLLPQLVVTLEVAQVPTDGDDLVERARSRVAAAHELRGGRTPKFDEQIADPIGRPPRIHEETGRAIEAFCRRLLRDLFS
jgi:protein-tyrosine phosphatase